MKSLKRLIVAALVIVTMSAVCVIPVSALVMTDSYFKYEVNFISHEATITKCLSNDTDIIVPSHYMDYKVTAIDGYAFENNQTLTTLSLPSTITRIENYALYNCKCLKYFTVPESVTYLGQSFCRGCTSLEKVYFKSSSISVIPVSAFSGCESLHFVQLNPSITTIGQSAFMGCSSLKETGFISDVSKIERIAFYKSGVETVDMKDGVEAIYDYTFAECASLQRVNVPQSVTYIDDRAFADSGNITLGVNYESYAHQYAVEKNIPYILLDAVLLDDVNDDGEITISDVTDIQRYLAELIILNDNQLAAADTNRDGTVDISDATALQMYLADYNIPYPIGEYITI